MKYAIAIIPENKEIALKVLDSLGGDEILFSFPPTVQYRDITIYSIPVLNQQGVLNKQKFFICTDTDIVEIEGIALVPVNSKEEGKKKIAALEQIIVWQNGE